MTVIYKRTTEQDYIDAASLLGVEIVNEAIQPGDLYLAGRNTGIKLFTCESVHPRQWIVSTDPMGYSFDTWECKKVVEVEEEAGRDYPYLSDLN